MYMCYHSLQSFFFLIMLLPFLFNFLLMALYLNGIAHERSLQTDILFGVVKRAMTARSYSATDLDNNIKSRSSNSITCNNTEDSALTNDEIMLQAMKNRAKLLNLPSLHVVVMSG
jgi:hypothetical protein